MKMKVICCHVSRCKRRGVCKCSTTFKPYCSFAISGFSEMKVKILRFIEYGRGTMSKPKTLISNTRSANT